MAKEQRLNSLNRFRKQPEGLVLEEHGHCEAPAGCAGIVMRWRNPHALVPVTILIYAPVQVECTIDGANVSSSRVDLTPGPHVLAIRMDHVKPRAPLLMLVFEHRPGEFQTRPPTGVAEPHFSLTTAADNTWKATTTTPANSEWQRAGFDDRLWHSMIAIAPPKLKWEDFGAYACSRCIEKKAECLGLPKQSKAPSRCSVWIRKVVIVPGPTS